MAAICGVVTGARGFMARQKSNYRVAVGRQAMSSFLTNLTAQYSSIYVTGLGASAVQLGGISSIASGFGALLSLPVGWLVDRYSLRKIYTMGVFLTAFGALLYGIAPTWHFIILASLAMVPASQFLGAGCSVVCRDSVANKDRLTAQNTCVTLASLSGLFAPMIAAALVAQAGGLTTEGIRPLYWIQAMGYLMVFHLVFKKLKEPDHMRDSRPAATTEFVADFRLLLDTRSPLKKWVVVALLTSMPMAITAPFIQLYAYEFKGADAVTLAAMTTAMVLTRLVFGIPLGRLADRFGRKRLIFALTPLWYASFIILVMARNPGMLIAAGALQTFYNIASGAAGAMGMELVPPDMAGRWHGVLGMLGGLVVVPAPLIGGLIYRHWNPIWVFLLPLLVDLIIRLPLLATVPETLDRLPDGSRED